MRRPPIALMLTALAVGLLAHAAAPEDARRELDEDLSLASDYATPHKPWAKGYARGSVRALFVVNTGHGAERYTEPGTRLREVVELMQRFDVTGDAVFVGRNKQGQPVLYGGKTAKERALRLLEQPYDVFVVGGVPLMQLEPELQYRILERVVKQGAGLVCCGRVPKKVMNAKRRMKALPAALWGGLPLAEMARRSGVVAGLKPEATDAHAASRMLACYQLGKGRGVALTYKAIALGPSLSFSYPALSEYDYWMALVGRAVLWAAGREPEVAVQVGDGKVAPLLIGGLDAARLQVKVSSTSPQPRKVRLEAELRRHDGLRLPLKAEPAELTALLDPATASVALPPTLRADRYYLDVVARSDRGVEAFAAGALAVASPVGIESVAATEPFVERGQPIQCIARLRGTGFARGDVLRLQLRDSFGRVLARHDTPVDPNRVEYTARFATDEHSTILMRPEAILLRGGREVELKGTSCLVPKRRRGRFNFVQWAARNDVLEYYAWRKLAEAGWTITLGCTDVLKACDVSAVPYSTRIVDTVGPDGVMKPVCWNDEAAATQHIQKIVDAQRRFREHGAFVYSLGDEGTTKGCCTHPACMRAYREYLEEQYGRIERLNASWGEQYKSFDEVQLLDPKDVKESKARGQGKFARWFDRQAFARVNLPRFTHRFVEAFARLDPQAITGFEGTGRFGDDFDAIIEANTFWTPYPSIANDILRGAAPRTLLRGNWMGYQKTLEPLVNQSWQMVMKGHDSIWWWRYDGCGSWRGYIRPTLGFWPVTKALCEEMRPVREGLGDVLLRSTVEHSGIGIFYSVAAALSSGLGDGKTYGTAQAAHESWLRATYDLGLDPRYLTRRLVLGGELTSGKFQVLVLPLAQALAQDEVAAIRKFVAAGGTVIADVRPGVLDGHCKPAAPGMLDAVLGIRRTGDGKAKRIEQLDIAVTLGGKQVAIRAERVRVDPSVVAAQAKALATVDGVPLVLVNRFGKGTAVLLNFQLPQRAKEATQARLGGYDLLRALYATTGAKPPVSVAAPDGAPLPFGEARVWRNAEATVFGIWHQLNVGFFAKKPKWDEVPPLRAKATLPEPLYVYDLRRHKALGRTREVSTDVAISQADFFLAAPYELKAPKLALSSQAPPRGSKLTVTLSLGLPDAAKAVHAVRVEIIDPSGKATLWGGRTVLLPGGRGQLELAVAHNDAPGAWRLRARELFTGHTAEATWSLK